MDPRWLIIGDDLTGAADSAIAFAKRRLPARVAWGETPATASSDVVALAFDADTRRLSRAEAASRHRDILLRLLDPGSRVLKKIDSTLRGHPADEIGAMVDVLSGRVPRLRVIFAPAFPAGGRVTRGGRVFVHGTPLERTEFWDANRPVEQAKLARLFESAGLRAHLVALDVVRGDPQRLRAEFDQVSGGVTICICDAEVTQDLDRIALTAMDDAPTLFAGSAGLAHSLASVTSQGAVARSAPILRASSSRGALLIVGSQAGPSRAALAEVSSMAGIRHLSVSADQLLDPRGHGLPLSELERALSAGIDVLIDVASPAAGARAMTPRVVDCLARSVALLAASASALMATGGDTAAALLSHAGAHGMQLVDELEPGATLGLTLGALSIPVVTKSGGFGDAGSLRRIIDRLRFIRQTGTVA